MTNGTESLIGAIVLVVLGVFACALVISQGAITRTVRRRARDLRRFLRWSVVCWRVKERISQLESEIEQMNPRRMHRAWAVYRLAAVQRDVSEASNLRQRLRTRANLREIKLVICAGQRKRRPLLLIPPRLPLRNRLTFSVNITIEFSWVRGSPKYSQEMPFLFRGDDCHEAGWYDRPFWDDGWKEYRRRSKEVADGRRCWVDERPVPAPLRDSKNSDAWEELGQQIHDRVFPEPDEEATDGPKRNLTPRRGDSDSTWSYNNDSWEVGDSGGSDTGFND